MKNAIKTTLRFIHRNLYFIILAICLLAIVLAVWFTIAANTAPMKVVDTSGNTVDVNEPINGENENDSGNSGENPSDGSSQIGGNDSGQPVWSNDPIVLQMPLENYTIGAQYSGSSHIYSETLREFRSHFGVDLLADEGAQVLAAASGTVESVESDILYGVTVVIKHTDELSTVYKSLDENPLVKVGDRVNTGEVIGTVGNTAMCEVALGAHLHFEVIESGEQVSPIDYLDFNDK